MNFLNNRNRVLLVAAIFFLLAAVFLREEFVNGPIWSDSEAAEQDAAQIAQATVTYPVKKVMTTLFWVGEEANRSNDYIANDDSAWDMEWVEHYGGVDDPDDRRGFYPADFTPGENPFYFALPYSDIKNRGGRKVSARSVPWYDGEDGHASILKNRWIEVSHRGNTCYAQWEDVGPIGTDDFRYVFGDAPHRNTFGVGAGLDVSPAMWDCLRMRGNVLTSWRFVEEDDVPDGPWREIITRR